MYSLRGKKVIGETVISLPNIRPVGSERPTPGTLSLPFDQKSKITDLNEYKIDSFQLVVYLVSGTELPADVKVGTTICNAVRIFFEEDDTRVLSYLCDSIDDRQVVRKREFDRWYNQFGITLGIDKVDATITVDNIQYLVSLLVSNNNLYQSAIKTEFLKSASSSNK